MQWCHLARYLWHRLPSDMLLTTRPPVILLQQIMDFVVVSNIQPLAREHAEVGFCHFACICADEISVIFVHSALFKLRQKRTMTCKPTLSTPRDNTPGSSLWAQYSKPSSIITADHNDECPCQFNAYTCMLSKERWDPYRI